MQRRDFLAFLGRTSVSLSAVSVFPWMTACQHSDVSGGKFHLKSLSPSLADGFLTSPSLKHSLVISHTQVINEKGETFGCSNDYIAYLPKNDSNPNDGFLWVNHEYPQELFVSGKFRKDRKNLKDVRKEQRSVGGSLLSYSKDPKSGEWKIDYKSKVNRRYDALTKIPFSGGHKINGKRIATGTMANCAGGVTPWNTFLSCEENYQDFYGEYEFEGDKKVFKAADRYGWRVYTKADPEHYGWVVEIDPVTGRAQKHVSMGRFAHEGATLTTTKDGRPVAYMGDDKADECVYKFIGSKKGSLAKGTLYVALAERGEWVPLTLENPVLKKRFKTETELLTRAREAAHLVGGTKLARPEGIAIDPLTGSVIVSLTNNKKKGNYHGSLYKIEETGNDPDSKTFKADHWIVGGESSGFSCPDNIAFDRNGNLWVTTDISDRSLNRGIYKSFKNNGLFVVPAGGESKRAIQVASAPVEAELTGPCFLPDGTLLISVQHPGNGTKSLDKLTSHWPHGGNSIPRSSVVAIQPVRSSNSEIIQ